MGGSGTATQTQPDRARAHALAGMRALIEVAPQAMAVLDETGAVLASNARYRVRQARAEAAGTRLPQSREPIATKGGPRLFLATLAPDDQHQASQQQPGRFLAAIADTLPVIVNLKDRESRYLLMNRYQAGIFGTTPAAAFGHTAAELMGAEFGAYVRGLDAQVFATGKPMPFFEETYPGADGAVRRWLTCKVPVTDAGGMVWGVATLSADITDLARREEELRQDKEQAEATSRARAGFLAAMTHELRTPLNAIIGFAELMQHQALGPIGMPDYLDHAGHILSSGRHLLALVNDVLDLARLESGRMVLQARPLELGALVHDTLDTIQPGAEAAGIVLARDITAQQVTIRADAPRLRQALLAVAGNAVKFTPRGGRVAVSMRPDMRGGAVITISDSGIGIAAENLPRLFEPFWQADTGLDRMREGAGIGLALAQRLVALHGGRLEVESGLGTGTKVTLHLPERPGLEPRAF